MAPSQPPLPETTGPPPGSPERRTACRRRQDRHLERFHQQYARKLDALQELGQLISLDLEVELLLQQLAEKATEVVKADRCSLFLYDRRRDELWSTAATGLEGVIIRIPAASGLAGACFQTGAVIHLEDAYADPRFNPGPDVRTGYRTRCLLCLPIFGRDKAVRGVLQLLNKKVGLFDQEDIDLLQTFVHQASVFLEMAQLQQARVEALEQAQEELRSLNRAKDKALHHLSHELRTPLSVIQCHLRLLERRVFADPPQRVSTVSSLPRRATGLLPKNPMPSKPGERVWTCCVANSSASVTVFDWTSRAGAAGICPGMRTPVRGACPGAPTAGPRRIAPPPAGPFLP